MNNSSDKKTYYLDFTTRELIGGKELLKTMPVFFNRVFFCKKSAAALWSSEENDGHYASINLTCKEEDIDRLRQVIKNNSLYVHKWDSLKNTEMGDYGFSFIGGNIKFILMPFRETDVGFEIRSYDCESGTCYTTNIAVFNKNSFAVRNFNESGELIGTCDFDLEDMNANNTVGQVAEKKSQRMAVYDNNGFAFASTHMVLFIILFGLVISWLGYLVISFFTLT